MSIRNLLFSFLSSCLFCSGFLSGRFLGCWFLLCSGFLGFRSLGCLRSFFYRSLNRLLNYCAKFLIESICLLKQFFAKCKEEGSFLSFRMVSFVSQNIVKVNGFFDDFSYIICLLARIDRDKKGAIIDKCTDNVLNVFLDIPKFHNNI